MLRMINELNNLSIFSIRTGDVVGTLLEPIIQPAGLKIVAFHAQPLRSRSQHILAVEDIREISPAGVIVDEAENIMELDGLVRIQDVIDIKFELIGKKVENESKNKMGKVGDYAIDDISWNIQKLYSSRSIVRDFTSTGRIIDRSQIKEVTDKRIIVSDANIKADQPQDVWTTNPNPAATEEPA